MNTPSYEFLSAPPWLIAALNVITLTLHLAAMGTVFGGLGVLLGLRLPGKWERPAVRRTVRLLPTLMSLTVTLGVAPLLFVQLVYHRQVYAAAIVSAWYWLAALLLVIVAYFLLYARALADRERAGSSSGVLGIALLLLLPVAVILSAVFTAAESPQRIADVYSGSAAGWGFVPELGSWLPRVLHLLAGALVLGSFFLVVAGRDDEELSGQASVGFLWALGAAVLLGFGALAALGEGLTAYMRSAAIWWLLAALATAMLSAHFLVRRQLVAAGSTLAVSLVAMVAQRHIARLLALSGTADPNAMALRPQWSVFALFLLCFVLMLAAVAWMLRLFFARPPGGDTP